MDPNQSPFVPQGQAAVGGLNAVRQAAVRRGMNVPVSLLNQVTPSSPLAAGSPTPTPAPTTSAIPAGNPAMLGASTVNTSMNHGMSVGQPEAKIILSTLKERLKILPPSDGQMIA